MSCPTDTLLLSVVSILSAAGTAGTAGGVGQAQVGADDLPRPGEAARGGDPERPEGRGQPVLISADFITLCSFLLSAAVRPADPTAQTQRQALGAPGGGDRSSEVGSARNRTVELLGFPTASSHR